MEKSYLKTEYYQQIRLKLFNNKFDLIMATKEKNIARIKELENEKERLNKELITYLKEFHSNLEKKGKTK